MGANLATPPAVFSVFEAWFLLNLRMSRQIGLKGRVFRFKKGNILWAEGKKVCSYAHANYLSKINDCDKMNYSWWWWTVGRLHHLHLWPPMTKKVFDHIQVLTLLLQSPNEPKFLDFSYISMTNPPIPYADESWKMKQAVQLNTNFTWFVFH